MFSVFLVVHIAAFSASLLCFMGAAVSFLLLKTRHRSAQLVGVVLGMVGLVSAGLLVAAGGSLRQVCISGLAYCAIAAAATALPSMARVSRRYF